AFPKRRPMPFSRVSWAASPRYAAIANSSMRDVTAKLLLSANTPISDPHGKMLDLLAGNPTDSETHDQMVQDLMRILEAQRIVSLDTLFQLADHIEAVAK